MIKFEKPQNLNGSELLAELNAGNVKITEPPFIDGNGDFWLEIESKDKNKATTIVSNHNGTIVVPDKTAARAAILDRLGLTVDEAAILLG